MTLVRDRNNADIELKVTTVETLGADTLAHGFPVDADPRSGQLVARLPGSVRVADGDVLPLAINPGMAHIFDAGSGRRV
jgi:sn-glycerol 3-phosphate transport system ATP-binding protein